MRLQGRIARWDDQKGYGHIEWHGGGEPVFVHIKAFRSAGRRPIVGSIVTYELGKDPNGRPRAERVEYPKSAKVAAPRTGGDGRMPRLFALLFVAALIALTGFGRAPIAILLAYVLASAVSFVLYGLDKAAAQKGQWRTEEATLLTAGLFCGWPGAIWAQQLLRHKSRKQAFQTAFWFTVVANLLALLFVLSPDGAAIRSMLSFG